jgi:hypothetical protein
MTDVDPSVDGPDAVVTPVTPDAAQDAVEEAHDNAWSTMQDAIAKFGEEGPIAIEDEVEAEADTEESGELEPAAEAEPEATAETQDAEPEAEPGSQEELKEETDTTTRAYQADGTLEWEEGTKVRFRADGRDVEVSDMDELIELAQKGAFMGRRNREIAEMERSFESREQGYHEKLQQAEKLLDQVLFDDEAYQRVKDVAEKFRDPEYREGVEAKQKLRESEEAKTVQGAEALREYSRQVGEGASQFFDENVGEYEYLQSDDRSGVLVEFFGGFQATRGRLHQQYSEQAKAEGKDPAAYRDHAEQAALGYLTQENLAAVMETHDRRYRDRLGSKTPTPEQEAEQHNRHVDEKLEQKRTRKSVRSGGAPPEPAPRSVERPTTWDGHWDRIREELGALRDR